MGVTVNETVKKSKASYDQHTQKGKYPSPTAQTNEEERPLTTIKKTKTCDGVHRLLTRWFQRDDLVFGELRGMPDLLPDCHVVHIRGLERSHAWQFRFGLPISGDIDSLYTLPQGEKL